MSSADIRIIVDFPDSADTRRRRLFRRPAAVFTTRDVSQIRAQLRSAEAAARSGKVVIGFLTYEAAPAFDAAFRTHPPGALPPIWFAAFDAEESFEAPAAVQAPRADWQQTWTRAEWSSAVDVIRDAIAAGRTYQINLTTRLRTALQRQSLPALYEHLRAAQGAGYHALIETPEFSVLSISPELFFSMREGRITARPMKGTRPRGRWPEEDARAAESLRTSAKDRAENLMIVDLVRNDIGHVATSGTVRVNSMFDVEPLHTLWQMTSTVTGELHDDATLDDVFAALFPCGSVTGAPKISSMEVIAELEQSQREIYCGALGIIEGDECTFNVPIRTLWTDAAGCATYGAGAGITWDSATDAELSETLAKAAILSEPALTFDLFETMRLQDGVAVRLGLHMERLLASCRYFGFDVRQPELRSAIAQAVAAHSHGAWRMRVAVDALGHVDIDVRELDQAPASPTFALAHDAVRSQDRMLFHKTSRRGVYDELRAAAPGVFDVLMINERGEMTEFTRGNLVIELDGTRWTPPLDAGLLPGVFRRQLLERQVMSERTLFPTDLHAATRIWFINSLREWVELHRPEK